MVVCGFLGSGCEKKSITSFVNSWSVFSDTSTWFHWVSFWGGCFSKRGCSPVWFRDVINNTLSFCRTIPSCNNLFLKVPIWISLYLGS